MTALSRKECEDLKPWVESTVRKVLGFSESSVAHAALGCMEKGFDKRRTKATLVALLDERVADRFVGHELFAINSSLHGCFLAVLFS